MDIKDLIGEATEYDKKFALEERKPKSWCKSVSAFANTFGGALIFGISNEYNKDKKWKSVAEKAQRGRKPVRT